MAYALSLVVNDKLYELAIVSFSNGSSSVKSAYKNITQTVGRLRVAEIRQMRYCIGGSAVR